jgi:hypothetical protein
MLFPEASWAGKKSVPERRQAFTARKSLLEIPVALFPESMSFSEG